MTAFGLGFLVGLICVGGLAFGLKLLLDATAADETHKNRRNFKYLGGGLLVVGQFLLCGSILFFSQSARDAALWVAAGLFVAIGLGVFAIKVFYKENS